MKLLLCVSYSSEFPDNSRQALIEINKASAGALLALREMALSFLRAACAAGIGSPVPYVGIGVGERIPRFELVNFASEPADGVAVLPDDFVPGPMSEDDDVRLEYHRVELSEDGVAFSGLSRYGSASYTTSEIPIGALRAIAEGRVPDIQILAP